MTSTAANIPASAATGSRWLGIFTIPGAVMAGLLLAAFAGLFFRWFKIQNLISSTQLEDWGHAYFIPLIGGYMIWKNRTEIAATRARVFWPALAPLALGIMSYFLGVVGIKNHMFQGFSIILTVFGLALLLLGPGLMRHLFLPIAFLVFAVTISEKIMIELTFPLQLIASQGGYFVLSIVGLIAGFSADVKGNLISLTDSNGNVHPLNIAAACSGMRMVVSFFALGGATALLGTKRWWQRVAIMLLAAPVAIFINVFRVAILGLASLADSDLANGEAHTLIGTILLIPGLLLFMLLVWAMNKAAPPVPEKPAPARRPADGIGSVSAAVLSPAFVACFLLLGGAGIGITAGIQKFHIYLQKKPIYPEPVGGKERVLFAIPTETAHWKREGSDHLERTENLEVLGTTNYLTRTYVEKNPKDPSRPMVIQLHAAYYTETIDTVPHVPERCYTGAGMSITGGPWTVALPMDTSGWIEATGIPESYKGQVFTTRLSNEYSTAGGGRRVNLPIKLTPSKPLELRISQFATATGQKHFAGYLFIGNGGWVSSAEEVRLLSFDLKQDYAYYMKIQVASVTVDSPEQLAAAAGSLFDDLLGEIMTCTPDWMKVESGEWPADNPKKKLVP